MQPIIYYCYDAYCGWCYGFSPVIKQIAEEYKGRFSFEVLSGGMIPVEHKKPIAVTASYINEAYPKVEELTGVKFGDDYLWHIKNPTESDWVPHSEKAAIALCIFKETFPDQQVEFASNIQYALYYEGRDLTDDEAYRHLFEKYDINAEEFYKKLNSDTYKEKAQYEFTLCKQLKVTAFPAVLLQTGATKFYLLARGFTTYQDLKARIENVIKEINEKDVR